MERSKPIEKYFTVHADMLLDTLQVVINNHISYEIKSVDADTNTVLLCVRKDSSTDYSKAVENIEAMLSEYRDYTQLLL